MQNMRNYSQRHNYMCGSNTLDLLPFYAQSMNLPGINFSLPEIGGNSGVRLNVSSDSVTFNSLTIDVIIDEDYTVYKEIMDIIFDHINVETGTFADFSFDFWIAVTDDMGKVVMKIEYYGCRFESVSDISLDSMDDTTETTFSVDLKYNYFKIIKSENIPSLSI